MLDGHDALVSSLSFSRDSRRLASASWDGTVLIWDLSPPPGALSDKELTSEWNALADQNARRAYEAIVRLGADPEAAVARLRSQLRPAKTPDAAAIEKLIEDLGSNRFAARDRAQNELAKLNDAAVLALRRALECHPPLEVQARVQQLLDRAATRTPRQLQELRAVELLERIGTPAAQQVLELLAGAPGMRLTEEAKASLHRTTLPTSSF